MYELSDSLEIFVSKDQKKLIIHLYALGKSIEIDNQPILRNLLSYLTKKRSMKELEEKFSSLDKSNLEYVIKQMCEIGVIKKNIKLKKNSIDIMVIGVGTTGSHIVRALVTLPFVNKIMVIDNDIVDESNLYRQDYFFDDLFTKKISVLKKRFNNKDIIGIDCTILSEEQLDELCKAYKPDVVIQAGDIPSSKILGKLTYNVCKKNKIVCILNAGYISNIINLPEFYFPGDTPLNVTNSSPGKKLFISQIKEKAKYSVAIQPAIIIAKQLENYLRGEVPIFYKKIGFYNEVKQCWEVNDGE